MGAFSAEENWKGLGDLADQLFVWHHKKTLFVKLLLPPLVKIAPTVFLSIIVFSKGREGHEGHEAHSLSSGFETKHCKRQTTCLDRFGQSTQKVTLGETTMLQDKLEMTKISRRSQALRNELSGRVINRHTSLQFMYGRSQQTHWLMIMISTKEQTVELICVTVKRRAKPAVTRYDHGPCRAPCEGTTTTTHER